MTGRGSHPPGATRIRPILMTAATTVLAMAPLAFGHGSGASERMPLGVVLTGGLISSTALSLLVVPVLYTLLDDGAQRLFRRHRRPAGHIWADDRPLPTAQLPVVALGDGAPP